MEVTKNTRPFGTNIENDHKQIYGIIYVFDCRCLSSGVAHMHALWKRCKANGFGAPTWPLVKGTEEGIKFVTDLPDRIKFVLPELT